jgi:hypothetical protein
MSTYLIPIAQLIALVLILLGIILMSEKVRQAVAGSYTNITIDRLANRGEIIASNLANALCGYFFLNKKLRPSIFKALLIGTVDACLLSLPIYVALAFWGFTFTHHLNENTDWEPVALPFNLAVTLGSTAVIHGGLEYLSATFLVAMLRRKYSLITIAARISIVVLAIWLTTFLLSVVYKTFFPIEPITKGGLLIASTLGAVLNGPTLTIEYLSTLSNITNPLLWLALASSVTFSLVILVPSFALLFTRSASFHWVLTKFTQHTGAASGQTLFLFGAGLFGFVTDFASSLEQIKSLFVH